MAFLKRTDVRRPTPVVGRDGDSVEDRPLISLFSLAGRGSSGLVNELLTRVGLESASFSLLSRRRFGGHEVVLGSDVMGRRVGGSRGVSPGGGDKARPVGSNVGGGVDLRSSRRGKKPQDFSLNQRV